MAGPLGVSHLLLFSRSTTGNTNLRLALTPRGPTLHFRVEKYSLCKDVLKAIKHPKGGGKEYLTAPLLVMNNFTSPSTSDGTTPAIPKHLESLTTMIFQSLFPPISPQTTPLSTIKRILLLNRELPRVSSSSSKVDDGSYIINLRHYAITTKRTGLSRGIKRLNAAERMLRERKNKHGVPNLGKLGDVADYLLDPSAAGGGFTSGSESEVETDVEVEVVEANSRKVLNKRQLEALRNNEVKGAHRQSPQIEKRAVKLVELGPRMKLRMTKVEEGVCGGKIMWHEYLHKSKDEVKEMERVWEVRRQEREERKRLQKENVERKRKDKSGPGKGEVVDEVEEDDVDDEYWDDEDLEDAGDMDIDEVNNVESSKEPAKVVAG